MESCPTFKLASGNGRPQFASRMVPQRILYFYFVDRDLGLMHVRLQTWAPFTCQVYVNGHDYLARQLKKKGVTFEQRDNAFVALGDPAAAQRLASRFTRLNWPKLLERYARRVNPLLGRELPDASHYCVRRSGRIRHRHPVQRPRPTGRAVPRAVGVRPADVQP
jgi:hypothetical protein